jgi:hypothetical protein
MTFFMIIVIIISIIPWIFWKEVVGSDVNALFDSADEQLISTGSSGREFAKLIAQCWDADPTQVHNQNFSTSVGCRHCLVPHLLFPFSSIFLSPTASLYFPFSIHLLLPF